MGKFSCFGIVDIGVWEMRSNRMNPHRSGHSTCDCSVEGYLRLDRERDSRLSM
jgi:hypothetical protein